MPTLAAADTLDANLAPIRLSDPALAGRIASAAPAPLTWADSRAGPPTATLERGGRTVTLASRYDPLAEAAKLVERVDLDASGCVVVLGAGLGHHVRRVIREMGADTVVIVFEPDAGLLRALFEQGDHTDWVGHPNLVLADGETERATILARLEGRMGMVAHGTTLLTHPPTRLLHGEALAAFGKMMADVASYARMHVATALVNAARTIENVTAALPWYVAGANTDGLHNTAAGFPAVCVGAGPSLAKNVDQLRDPAVRKRVVVITAQTTLKPLLDRGIRPDFVTALDYSEISGRFYEDLPPLPGVTLVAEPKAHASVFDRFPGPVRVTPSGFLDRLIGAPEGARQSSRVPIRDGATVAHLSFYLAQHLGCDPVIMIGQDLGFSDGLYYCPGTAIHQVWAPELGPFNTLEMMEWQRIVRHRALLHRAQDVAGRPIFTDEQMATYLSQFERDFAGATQRVLDATEGGMPKAGAAPTTLAEALREHATRDVPPIPVPPTELDPAGLEAVAKLLARRREEVVELRALSQRTLPLLRQMLEHQRDAPRMDKLFKRLKPLTTRAAEMNGTLNLVNELNTVGTFKRIRADRAINRPGTADAELGTDAAFERQRRQLDRDIDNIDWISQACDEALRIFDHALVRTEGLMNRATV